jgi:hypothetical protein
MKVGERTTIIPMVYQIVLRKAHQRTFNLQTRLKEAQPAIATDPEVDEVLRQDEQPNLFNAGVPKPHIPTTGDKAPLPDVVQREDVQ